MSMMIRPISDLEGKMDIKIRSKDYGIWAKSHKNVKASEGKLFIVWCAFCSKIMLRDNLSNHLNVCGAKPKTYDREKKSKIPKDCYIWYEQANIIL
jgi:hypothetical protein